MKQLLFLLPVFCMSTLVAQRHSDHFVVTNNRDTIYGHLKYQNSEGDMHNIIKVKVNDTLKYSFSAKDIIYFEEGINEYYSFVPHGQSEHFFMRVWATGNHMELFEWEVPMSISKKKHLIEYRPFLRKKGDADFVELDHKHWKKQLADMMADYPELAADILSGMYPMDEMNHIIDRYNEFKDEENETW